MKINLLLNFFAIITIYHADALPTGPSLAACQNLRPAGVPGFGHFNAVFEDLGYRVRANPSEFTPGSDVVVLLTGDVTYRGLFLQVRDGPELQDSVAVGSWESSVLEGFFRLVDCTAIGFSPNSALGHSSAVDKQASQGFVWTAPDCENNQQFFLRVTVVRNLLSVQEEIVVNLTCSSPTTSPSSELPFQTINFATVTEEFPLTPGTTSRSLTTQPASTNVSTTTTLLPTSTSQVSELDNCQFSSMNSIPSDYNNDFEDQNRNLLKGWRSLISNGYSWRPGRGPTHTLATGPSSAFSGAGYVFVEASFPARAGNVAILTTRKDLRGCFCFSFVYNFNVDNRGHNLVVEVDGQERLRATQRSSKWSTVSIQVDTPNLVQIRIIATRGSSWLGDIALDNVAFTPGRC